MGQEISDCIRGEPEPLFKDKDVKEHLFNPVSSHEASEEVVFKSGARLLIRHWGCEYYVITFRYESRKMPIDVNDRLDPFIKASEVLRIIASYYPRSVFDGSRAAEAINSMILEGKELKIDEQYPIEGDGTDFLQTRIIIRGSGALKGVKGAYVEFDLLKGPL